MYTQSITRTNRTAFIIVIDQSGSMAEKIAFMGRTLTKAEAVSEVANRILFELIERSRRDDGIHDYFDIAVIGYSDGGVRSLLTREIGFIPVTELAGRIVSQGYAAYTFRQPDGRAILRNVPLSQWIAPQASGSTPMYEALLTVRDLAKAWCADVAHLDSFPPLVFNITDGEASDCDESELRDICRQIRTLGTRDGNLFLINTHIASGVGNESLVFPSAEEIGRCGNRYARLLFECSSEMPEMMNDAIRDMRDTPALPPFRGMSYNASIAQLLTILNIGSISLPIQ